jgi:carbonic anhydrase/acetyltransferase-like protein (isoleucine patch superfamily)
MISRILRIFKYFWIRRSGKSIIEFYRKQGCTIGDDYFVIDPKCLWIDYSRPSLVEIGHHVFFHKNLTIHTHDYVSWVFVELYDEFLPSSGRVKIGNNVWFGQNCTVLKGVTIGDNCIIGFGSVITKNIPPNSVAVGVPARVICTIEEYYEKRKKQYVEEAIDYAKSVKERLNREPNINDFMDDYPCFTDGNNYANYPMIPFQRVLKNHFEVWKKKHKSEFNGFHEFMEIVNSKKNSV